EDLSRQSEEEVLSKAVQTASRIFKVEPARIRDSLVASYMHNWLNDPFSLGAYSYTPVGAVDIPGHLSQPVAGTLFFAGEAADTQGEQGTVHGAIASGKRAAAEIVR